MEGKQVIMVTLVVVIIGIFVSTIGFTAIDSLETMVDDAESFQETTSTEYHDNVTLSYNTSLNATQNTNDTYDHTDIRDGDSLISSQYNLQKATVEDNYSVTHLFVDEGDVSEITKNGSASYKYVGTSDELINITWDYKTLSWSNESGYNSVDLETTMTVYTNHTHTESTTNLLSLMPIFVAVGIIIVLIAIVMKVVI